MAEFLLELFSEEIPARMQGEAAKALSELIGTALIGRGLTPEAVEFSATPRRLFYKADLPAHQPDVTEERKGPRADAPAQAIEGFLKSVGLTRDQVQERDTGKGIVLFAVTERKGQPTTALLAELIPDVIRAFPWPKSQRWGAGTLRWVRPLQSILALFGSEVIDFAVDGIPAGNTTFGHRFLAPGEITVTDYASYKAKLYAARVMLSRNERMAEIESEAKALATAAGYELIEDRGLIEEVAGLVEWPVVLMGQIDDAFMSVPSEVLTATMRANQKYFSLASAVRPEPVEGQAGFDKLSPNGVTKKLAPRFILVSNMETSDGGAAIVAGNERVLRARLSDAKFFWDQDRKVTLESRPPALDGIVFHAKLGSVGERVRRMERLAADLAPAIPGCDAAKAARAARLAKADLTSGMVGEFPEVQGIMGRYYALGEGEDKAVAEAIAEHYSPKGPSDACPKAPVSVAVALAEKIDTLVGFFLIGEKPTGSKDPFALRRAALGVIRLIIENNLRLSLEAIFDGAVFLYGRSEAEAVSSSAVQDLIAFFADRLKVHLRDQGVRHDLIDAIFSQGGEDDLVRLLARVSALQSFLASDDGANLLVAYRRASNIVRIEEKKDDKLYDGTPDAQLFAQDEERELWRHLLAAQDHARRAVENEKYETAMSVLARLRAPVDAFFASVTVNADDAALRRNRLLMLSQIRAALDAVADFSKIEG